jgi:hypothetical protein
MIVNHELEYACHIYKGLNRSFILNLRQIATQLENFELDKLNGRKLNSMQSTDTLAQLDALAPRCTKSGLN